jgi:hypothetical protein
MGVDSAQLTARWSAFGNCPEAVAWLRIQADLGLAPRTIDAYARGLADYLTVCQREGHDPLTAGRAEIARYVRDLAERPNHRGPNVIALDSGIGLANATLQQRLVAVRLFYDHLIEEGRRETNPVGRGRYTPTHGFGGQRGHARAGSKQRRCVLSRPFGMGSRQLSYNQRPTPNPTAARFNPSLITWRPYGVGPSSDHGCVYTTHARKSAVCRHSWPAVARLCIRDSYGGRPGEQSDCHQLAGGLDDMCAPAYSRHSD